MVASMSAPSPGPARGRSHQALLFVLFGAVGIFVIILAWRGEPLSRAPAPASVSTEPLAGDRAAAAHTFIHAPDGRAFPGTHRWMSDPAAGFPAWIMVWYFCRRSGLYRAATSAGM